MLGRIVLLFCMATVLPSTATFIERSARATLAAPTYRALDLGDLGTLGQVSANAEIAQRASIMLEHYAAQKAAYRDLAARGQMPSHLLSSQTDYQATWLFELRQGLVAIREWEAGTGRRLNGVFSLDFVDPLNRLLGREPPRHVAIGMDPMRTTPPLAKDTLAALDRTDAILQPSCPAMVTRAMIAAHFAPALEGRRRVVLSPCWDMYLKP
jgi:hypothetical protein